MEIRQRQTIPFNFGDKHLNYIRNCRINDYNFAEGAVRAGKTVDNIFAFSVELMTSPDRIHLATGSTVGNAKLNLGDANGFGLEHIFRGQCRWTKYKDNEALIIKGVHTRNKEKIIIFAGGAKADSFKKIRGNSYGMWIGTEVNLHHEDTIKEAFNRTAAAKKRKFFWDLNPDHPKHFIYTNYIDKYQTTDELRVNYQHFTIDDNINLPRDRIDEIKAQYDPDTVWYQRDILGRRMVAEGLIYRSFANNPNRFIINDIPRLEIINIGVDFGGNKSKHAFVATGITFDKKIVVLKSIKVEPDDAAALILDLQKFIDEILYKYKRIDEIYVDNAEQVLKRSIANNIKVNVKNSVKNPIIDRIRLTDKLMNTNRFFITNDCETLVEALSMAVWDSKQITKNVRLDDGTSDVDTLDAFEYSFEKYMKLLNM